MTSKIFRSTVSIAAIILLCSFFLIVGVLYGYANDVQVMQLKDELSLAVIGTERSGIDFLNQVEAHRFRVTWIRSDGSVIYDSHVDTEQMENHLQREEIQSALHYGSGSAVRRSDTLLERQIYEAKRLSDGSVLRISVSQQTLMALMAGMLGPACLVAVLALILSAILARRTARKIVEPLNRLDLEHPLENDTYEELSPLLCRIHQQQDKIASRTPPRREKAAEAGPASA